VFLNPEKEEAILDEKALQLGGVLKALRFLKLGRNQRKILQHYDRLSRSMEETK
jgi:hypothetical protein